jgi:hypothetical protein
MLSWFQFFFCLMAVPIRNSVESTPTLSRRRCCCGLISTIPSAERAAAHTTARYFEFMHPCCKGHVFECNMGKLPTHPARVAISLATPRSFLFSPLST